MQDGPTDKAWARVSGTADATSATSQRQEKLMFGQRRRKVGPGKQHG